MNRTMLVFLVLLLTVALMIFAVDVSRSRSVADIQTLEEAVEAIEELESRVDRLELELEKNLLADCLNEGVLKAMVGVQPSSLEECRQERDRWMEEYENSENQPTNNEM